jgi:hypothetical protein
MKSITLFAVLPAMGVFMLFAAIRIYSRNVHLDLSKQAKLTGHIKQVYETTRHTGKTSNVPVIAFELDNFNQVLGAYRPSRNYSYVLANLKPGDLVTIYYKPSDAYINIDLYQLEKGGKIMLDYSAYSRNYSILSVFLGIFGIAILLFGIRQIRLMYANAKDE